MGVFEHVFLEEVCTCVFRTGVEVVVFEHVALQATAGEVLAAVGHRATRPQAARVLLVLLRVDIQAAPC